MRLGKGRQRGLRNQDSLMYMRRSTPTLESRSVENLSTNHAGWLYPSCKLIVDFMDSMIDEARIRHADQSIAHNVLAEHDGI